MDMLGFSHCTQACGYEAPMSHHYQVAVPMHDRYLLPVHVCPSLAVKGARSHRNNTKACRDIHKHVECHAAKYQCQTDFTGASNTPVSQTQRTRKYNANTRRRNALESIMPTRANDTQVHVKTVTQATVHHVTYAHRLHAVALAACASVRTRGVGLSDCS